MSLQSSSSSRPEEIERYEHQLDHLTQTINSLLDGLDSVARDVNIAKETQEKLYSAHHKVPPPYLYCNSSLTLTLTTGEILSARVCVDFTNTKSFTVCSERASKDPCRDARAAQRFPQIDLPVPRSLSH
jgi:hypothetical protein